MSSLDDTSNLPRSAPPPDRRKQLLLATGAIVAVALIGAVLVTVFGGEDEKNKDEVAAPVIQPLELTEPADTSGIIGVDGAAAQLSQSDLDAILASITGYLKDATVTPLSTPRPDVDDDSDETTTPTVPAVTTLTTHFTDSAGASLDAERLLAVADLHLPFAKDGVSTSRATVSLAGLVQDGAAQFVNARIDITMLVKADDDITVERTGELVLRPVGGEWKIAAYTIAVERAFGDQTTTSEAAFG